MATETSFASRAPWRPLLLRLALELLVEQRTELKVMREIVKRDFGKLFDEAWKLYPEKRTARPAARAGIRKKARSRAYAWLATQLGLPVNTFALSRLSKHDCEVAIRLMATVDAASIREWDLSRRTMT